MKRFKLFIGICALLCAAVAIFCVLRSDHALVTHPKGIIAKSQLDLIVTNILLMLVIVVPTFIVIYTVAWKYRAQNTKAKYTPDKTYGVFGEVIVWIIPSIIVVVMAVITWRATHALDPYKPLESEVPPLTIQVVALDWKWLFIYPEQGIATLNFVQFPEQTPIHFLLSADNSPMNSFWLPEMSGQIYTMTGMVTQLHIMADASGEYKGRAAEINGEGYADMTFVAKSTSPSDFQEWVAHVKQAPLKLTQQAYDALVVPHIDSEVRFYSSVENDLFNKLVMKYMHPHHTH